MKYLLTSIIIYLLSGCGSNVALPPSKSVAQNSQGIKAKKYQGNIEYQGLNKKKIRMPREGEENAYLIVVSKELEIAYDNYLGGDADKALSALKIASQKAKSNLEQWQISFLKTKVYMLLGLDADAQVEIEVCKKYEQAHFKHHMNSTALQGEIDLMEGNFDKAREKFQTILSSIGNWDLPTSYGLPPSNMPELVAITTAQLRAYTGMASSYVMQNEYKKAKVWAIEAEARFNAVHYVGNHGIYGMFFHTHLDSYYGRAMNMVMLASALLGAEKDYKKSDFYYKEALNFFNAINYKKGEIIALALHAQTLSSLKKFDEADEVALKAIEVANKNKMYDFIWRIETLRGKLLLEDKKRDKAEKAFRNAANVIDLVSGDLQTDFSKRRFAVGKDDLVYYLMQISKEKKDYKQLFLDVENGRARSFVDLMRNRSVGSSHSQLLYDIQKIDKKIKKIGIENYSFSTTQDSKEDTSSKEKEYLLYELSQIDPDSTSMQDTMTKKRLLEMLHELEARNTAISVQKNPSKLSQIGEESLRKMRKALVQKLLRLNPQSAAVISSSYYSFERIKKALTKEESILYFLPVKSDEKIEALLITSSGIKLKTFPLTQTKLSKIMQQYLIKIGAYDNSLTSQMRSFKKKSKITSKQVVSNIKNPLADLHKLLSLKDIQTKRLYIVGSGATTYIPWATYDKSIEFALLPNASWILHTSKSTNYSNVVIVGNPNYGGELDQLPGTVKEAQALAKVYNVKPLLYKNATIKNIQKNIGNGAKVLHLATHGVFYSDKPLDSAIFLSQDSKLYTLSAKEIFKSPIKADLVVLSACETGMGANVAGDDLLGLPRSFFLGGTKAIVSSLWPIDDIGTKEFMIEFHKYAKDGAYEKGLLKAKEHLKAKGYPASIYGAFVLYGMSL